MASKHFKGGFRSSVNRMFSRGKDDKIIRFDKSFQMAKAVLLEKTKINHDSYIFRIKLPDSFDPINFTPGSHFVINGVNDTDQLKRKYTPIQRFDPKIRYFDTLIKIYRPNVHPIFPDGGFLTPQLESLEVGQSLNIAGPLVSINYEGKGKFKIRRFKQLVDREKDHDILPEKLLFIAGGTGIAPFFSMIQQMCIEGTRTPEVTVLFANKSVEDIFLKDQLDKFAATNPNIKIIYVIDKAEEGVEWKGEVGYINYDLIKKYAPPVAEGNYIMMCGNKPMQKGCFKAAEQLGYDPYHTLVF